MDTNRDLASSGHDARAAGADNQRTIDFRLIRDNIVNVSSQAYVLGIFDHVNPTGAARHVDRALGGNLKALIEDRMLGGNLGEISIVPTPRQRALADMVVFVGLGPIGTFKTEFLEGVGEKLIRFLVTAKVSSFTTVPISLNAGSKPGDFIEYFAKGLVRGLVRADPNHDFRRVDLVEYDEARFEEIVEAAYEMRDKGVFRPAVVTIREIRATREEALMTLASTVAAAPEADPIYLTVCEAVGANGAPEIRYDVLTNLAKATIAQLTKPITAGDRDALNEIIARLSTGPEIANAVSEELCELMIEGEIRKQIVSCVEEKREGYLIIRHDKATSHVPWEVVRAGGYMLAVEKGMSRIYMSDKALPSFAPRVSDPNQDIDVLVVGDPTGDLRGARRETERLVEILTANSGLSVESLLGKQATKGAILEKLHSGKFEVVHYAGHAFFDLANPSRSGLICAGGDMEKDVLSGKDIYGLPGLPWLIFCNACESGMIWSPLRNAPGKVEPAGLAGTADASSAIDAREQLAERLKLSADRNLSVAEAFLLNGIPQFIGTYWPVGDVGAKTFGTVFYNSLAGGDAIGVALRKARQELWRIGDKDWATYMHYGWPMSRLRDKALFAFGRSRQSVA